MRVQFQIRLTQPKRGRISEKFVWHYSGRGGLNFYRSDQFWFVDPCLVSEFLG